VLVLVLVLGFPFDGGGDVSAWAETCRRVGVLQSCSSSSSSSIAYPTSRTTERPRRDDEDDPSMAIRF
jgi:hypothetical protein